MADVILTMYPDPFALTVEPYRDTTLALFGASVVVPAVPPTVSGFLPAADTVTGRRYMGRRTPIEFDVLGSFARVEIAATFKGLTLRDVVYDSEGFAPLYVGSTFDGEHFSILRAAGWPAGRSPSLHVRAYASDGTVSVLL